MHSLLLASDVSERQSLPEMVPNLAHDSLAHSVHVGEKIAITHKNISTNESSSIALSKWKLDPASWGEDPLVWHNSVSYKKRNYFESKEFWLEKILIQSILEKQKSATRFSSLQNNLSDSSRRELRN